jgi:hypothetical protein
MEPGPRTAAGAHRLRPLNEAQPVRVRSGVEGPSAVEFRGRWRTVGRVEEAWRLDDGWWRPRPVRRIYYRLALDGGCLLTIYRDALDGGWWMQRY